MSRFEENEFINDRYAAMEERLAVSFVSPLVLFPRSPRARARSPAKQQKLTARSLALLLVNSPLPKNKRQIVRKRLNKPMTLAEKVRSLAAVVGARL
jgi:hypothetical protein